MLKSRFPKIEWHEMEHEFQVHHCFYQEKYMKHNERRLVLK